MLEAVSETKYLLAESEIPTRWYNIISDLPTARRQCSIRDGPAGRTGRPRAALPDGADRPGGQQRASRDPRGGPQIYRLWRPTPLYRAVGSSGARHAGAHLLQVRGRQPGRQPQAEHRRGAGLLQQAGGPRRLATETGAGQWGSALAFACGLFGLECKVYMVKVSYEQKPYRRSLMQVWGA